MVMRLMVDGNSNEAEKRGGGGGERWGLRREAELEAEVEADERCGGRGGGDRRRRRWSWRREVEERGGLVGEKAMSALMVDGASNECANECRKRQ